MDEEMTSTRASALLRTPLDQRAPELSEGAVMAAWTEWLYDEHGYGLNEAQRGQVYSLAWEHGHSAGLGEVESYFVEFAQFARELLAAS